MDARSDSDLNAPSEEIEASQDGLRKSRAETERLVGESEKMLRRHRKECEENNA